MLLYSMVDMWKPKRDVWFKHNDDSKLGKKFTYEQHIKKHTKKENTYDSECEHCQ